MYDQSQLLRGTLEGCILAIIRQERTYGYGIASTLQACGFPDVKEGTLYPLLVRLEKKGMITGEFQPSPLGPSRKYYTITEEGERLLAEFHTSWRTISQAVEQTVSGEYNERSEPV